MGERTAKRPVASGRIAPERALEFGIALSAFSFVLLDTLVNLADRAARARRQPLLRLRLHALAEAHDAAEHRDRRRRRRRAAARRLRERDRSPRLGRARDVRDRLPLDAAALLGARADDPRALRERTRADAARRARRPRDRTPDRLVHRRDGRGDARARRVRPLRARLRRVGDSSSASLFAWLAWRLWRELTRPRAVALFHYSLLYLALLFVAMAVDVTVSGESSHCSKAGRRTRSTRRSSRRPSSPARTPRWAWSLFVLSLLLFGGTFLIGLTYLWLD